MFFEMRFDRGTLDSGERSLPFGLLVCLICGFTSQPTTMVMSRWSVNRTILIRPG